MEEEIDLRQYVEVIKRWLWLIVLGATLAAGAAFVVSLFIPPTYEAEASVVLAKAKTEVTFDPNIKTVSSEQLARAIDQATQRQTLADLAGSTEIATRVVAKLGDLLSPEEQDVRTLTGMVEAKTDRNSNLIQLTVHSTDPEKAAKIANAWAKEYVDYVNNQVYSGTPQTPEEIAAQAKEAKAAYDKAEAELVQFLGDNQLAELQRQLAEKKDIIAGLQASKKTATTIAINKQKDAKSQIFASYVDAETKAQLAVFEQQVQANLGTLKDLYALRHKLDRLLSNAKSLQNQIQSGTTSPTAQTANTFSLILLQVSSFTTAANLPVNLQVPLNQLSTTAVGRAQLDDDVGELIHTLEAKRSEVQTEIDTLSSQLLQNEGYRYLSSSTFTDAPPSHENDILLTTAQGKLQDLLQMEGLDPVIADSVTNAPLTKAINQLQREVNQLTAKLESTAAHKQELTRARDLAHETYKSLARKVAEVDIAAQSKSTEVKFAVPAVTPLVPVAPRKMMNTLLAGVVGLMLMLGIAFVAEFMDDSLRPDDVERLLHRPTLGRLPRWEGAVPAGQPIALKAPQSPLTESLRALRTNLQVLTPEPLRSLLVTSPNPEEGKSTIVANLGTVMAQTGKKVVLVEGDLRRPTLHKHFGLPVEKGLSNLLAEEGAVVSNCLQETGISGLRLLTSGPLPPNPADLLDSKRMATVLRAIQEEADMVLVDSPAVGVITDALLLARQVDGVLLVAEQGVTGRQSALQVQEILTQAGAHLLGIVLTKVNPESLSAYRYYTATDSRQRRPQYLLRTLQQWAGTWNIFSSL